MVVTVTDGTTATDDGGAGFVAREPMELVLFFIGSLAFTWDQVTVSSAAMPFVRWGGPPGTSTGPGPFCASSAAL